MQHYCLGNSNLKKSKEGLFCNDEYHLLKSCLVFKYLHSSVKTSASCQILFPAETEDYKSVTHAFTLSITQISLTVAFLLLLFS